MKDAWQMSIDAEGVATCVLGDKSWNLTVGWEVVEGRPEPTQLTVSVSEGEPSQNRDYLNAVSVRSLPIGHVISELRRRGDPERYASSRIEALNERWQELDYIRSDMPYDGGSYREEAAEMDAVELATADQEILLKVSQGPQRGRSRTLQDHQAVADVYRAAYKRGDPRTRAVADAFNVSISTAGKRIMAARKAGLLEGIGRKQ